MSGFVIFVLVLTFVYVVYFAVMITLDLHGKKDEKKSEEETDRTNPQLDIYGVKEKLDVVKIIRERVEYNKRRKGIYEITNR